MKRLLPSCLLLALTLAVYGQQGNNPNAYSALSARVQAMNYGIPNDELGEVSFTYALELGYRRQLGKYFGIAAPFRLGVIDVGRFENPVIAGADVLAQLYPFGSRNRISPYLHTGFGAVTEDFENANLQLPLGAGINFLLGENSWASLQGEYRLSDEALRDNVQFGVGYIYRLSSFDLDRDGIVNREDACPDVFGLPETQGCPDRDGDRIADQDDACPDVPGTRSLNGCPDRDGDGITDAADNCPDEAGPQSASGCPDGDEDGVANQDDACPDEVGPAELKGCPDGDGDGLADRDDRCPTLPGDPDRAGCPDTDGDGRYDHEDDCPTVAAATPDGCPLPDGDGDGVPDANDRCPAEAGPPSNAGCPVPKKITEEVREKLEFATETVAFETGSAKLTPPSYSVLTDIVTIMKQYPGYKLVVSGHTDNVGTEANNQRLSERRAAACGDFLLAAGIAPDRIERAGFGESEPRASNANAAGRKLNRRVAFDLVLR